MDGFHSIYPIKWETSRRIYVVWGETDKTASNIQARSFMARTLEQIDKNAKLKEKQKWSLEKPKLDNARKMRGIYFIDPETRNLRRPSRMLARNWKHLWLPLCLARLVRTIRIVGVVHPIKSNQNLRVFWKLVNLQDCVWENHCRLIIQKGSSGQGMGKLEKFSAWNLTNVRSKKEVMNEARTKGAKVHFASLMDICHLKNAELEAKHQKYKGRVVLRGDIAKHDSGSHAVFTEQRSSVSQMTAAKIMDIISRLPGCAGQAADAVSACTQVIMEDAPKLLKIPKSECPDIWIRLPQHKWPKSWSSMEDPVVPLERNLYGHPLAGLLWERQFEKILLQHGWEKIPNWECLFVHREKGLFLSVYVDDIKLAGKKRNIDPMWEVLNKEVDLGEPTSFFDHVYLGCTQRQCEISKDIVDNYRTMFESRISAKAIKNTMLGKSSNSFVVLRYGRSCQEMCGAIL